jgi:hypothetical protein
MSDPRKIKTDGVWEGERTGLADTIPRMNASCRTGRAFFFWRMIKNEGVGEEGDQGRGRMFQQVGVYQVMSQEEIHAIEGEALNKGLDILIDLNVLTIEQTEVQRKQKGREVA